MDKETSSRVSTIAAEILNMMPEEGDVRDARYNELLDKAQTVAGSALSQDETPGRITDFYSGKIDVDRLHREHAQLSGKLDALTLFLGRGASGVAGPQLALLEIQLSIMAVYKRVLEMRLHEIEKGE